MRNLKTTWLLGLVASLLVMAACGSAPKGPRGALEAYGNALRTGNYETAYGLMSASFRDRYTKEEFIRMMNESPTEVSDTASRLRGATRDIETTAELRYGHGDRILMILENDRWRIVSNPIYFYSQSTPRDALRSFVRAYRLRRWDVMLRLVPNEFREKMDVKKIEQQFEGDSREDVDAMMKMLETSVEQPLTEKTGEARMAFGGRYEVKLILDDDGLWKVLDIE